MGESEELPDRSSCRNCGRPIGWIDYGYVHWFGNAECMPLSKGTYAEPAELNYA